MNEKINEFISDMINLRDINRSKATVCITKGDDRNSGRALAYNHTANEIDKALEKLKINKNNEEERTTSN